MLIRGDCLLWVLLWQIGSTGAKFERGSSSSSGRGNPNADRLDTPSAGQLWPIQSTGGGFLDGVLDHALTQLRPPVRDPAIATFSRQAAYGRTEMWDFHAWSERVIQRPELRVAGMYVYGFPVEIRGLGLLGNIRVVWDASLNFYKFEFTMNFHLQTQLRILWPLRHGKELISIDLYFGVYNALDPFTPMEPGSRIVTPESRLAENRDLGVIRYGNVRIRYSGDLRVGPQFVTSRLMYDEQNLWRVDRHGAQDQDQNHDHDHDQNHDRHRHQVSPAAAFESRLRMQWYFVVGEGDWVNAAPPLLLGPPDGQEHHHHDPNQHGHDQEVPERPTTPPRHDMSHRGRRRPPSPS